MSYREAMEGANLDRERQELVEGARKELIDEETGKFKARLDHPSANEGGGGGGARRARRGWGRRGTAGVDSVGAGGVGICVDIYAALAQAA